MGRSFLFDECDVYDEKVRDADFEDNGTGDYSWGGGDMGALGKPDMETEVWFGGSEGAKIIREGRGRNVRSVVRGWRKQERCDVPVANTIGSRLQGSLVDFSSFRVIPILLIAIKWDKR